MILHIKHKINGFIYQGFVHYFVGNYNRFLGVFCAYIVKTCAVILTIYTKKGNKTKKNRQKAVFRRKWSGRQDSNLRPPGPKPGALPNWATPGYYIVQICAGYQTNLLPTESLLNSDLR